MTVTLRPFSPSDADLVFDWMRDPESVALAAFTADDPDDRAAFDAFLERVLERPDVRYRMVDLDGVTVGTISTFDLEGEREISYWVDRAHWGRGVASAAVGLMLAEDRARPLGARAALHNVASQRALVRHGFVAVDREVSYANGLEREVEEIIYRLG